ncbi:MAG: YdcF family protein [Thiotrichales bacterium]
MPEVYLTRLIELLLLPPGGVVTLGVIALLALLAGARRGATALLLIGVALLWLTSTPWFAFLLLDPLQDRYPMLERVPPDADSIIVLGGGTAAGVTEFGTLGTVVDHGLMRARYAGFLAQRSGLPVITTGGDFGGREPSEALLAQAFLERELGVATVYSESSSQTTYENAIQARDILDAKGLRRPLIVTHYWHMPRAIRSFRVLGMDAIAAPVARVTRGSMERGAWQWVPQVDALRHTRYALHEWLGQIWYAIRPYFSLPRPVAPVVPSGSTGNPAG